jgi:trigger factor
MWQEERQIMNKKTLFALVTGALIAVSLGGCGSSKEEEKAVEQLAQTTELTDYSSYVTLGQYTDFEIAVDDAEVTEDMLNDRMEQVVDLYNYAYAETEQITDREVVMGDTIDIDFTTEADGETLSGLAGVGVSYGVGSGQIQESLDEQLVGLKPGKSYDIQCSFESDSDFEALAGKDVTFHVTINYIYGDTNTLEWGDELVSTITNGEYKKADKYKDYLYEQLQMTAEEEQKQEYIDALWEAVLADCTFAELPEDIIEENAESYYENQKAIYEYYATYYSYTYDEYMQEKQGMTDEEFHEKAYEYARTELERIYTAVTIFKAQGMELTDEEFSREVAELAERYGYDSSAEFVETYGEEYVREVIVTGIVEEYLQTNNKMTVNGK